MLEHWLVTGGVITIIIALCWIGWRRDCAAAARAQPRDRDQIEADFRQALLWKRAAEIQAACHALSMITTICNPDQVALVEGYRRLHRLFARDYSREALLEFPYWIFTRIDFDREIAPIAWDVEHTTWHMSVVTEFIRETSSESVLCAFERRKNVPAFRDRYSPEEIHQARIWRAFILICWNADPWYFSRIRSPRTLYRRYPLRRYRRKRVYLSDEHRP